MQKGMLQNSPPEFLIRGATHSIGCSHSPGHLRVSSYRDTAKLGVMGQRWCLPAHADRRTEILAAPGAVRIRDVASSPDLSHACTMLKRQGLHLRPLPKRRRTVVRQTSAAHRGSWLQAWTLGWLRAALHARHSRWSTLRWPGSSCITSGARMTRTAAQAVQYVPDLI